MRQNDPIDLALKEWGFAASGRYGDSHIGDRGAGSHPIARARQFAPGTRAAALQQIKGRDGRDRRHLMGAQLEKAGHRILPTWAADPVTCTETRHAGPISSRAAVDGGIPQPLMKYDQAITALWRHDRLQGTVVRIQYTARCTQEEKAALVSANLQLTPALTLRQYRTALKAGRTWLAGRVG